MRKPFTITFAICLLPALASPVLAGGFNEGGDAGRKVREAQPVAGSPGDPVLSISGQLSGALRGGPGDFEDIYEIFIDKPNIFEATTVGSAAFDTELFLFKPVSGSAMLANDDDEAAGTTQSLVPHVANDNDPNNASLPGPGSYFLAISTKGDKPTSNGGLMFFQANAIEVSGPDGPGAASTQNDWTGPLPAATVGVYTIKLKGVVFLPKEKIPSSSLGGLLLVALILVVCGGLALRGRRLRPA